MTGRQRHGIGPNPHAEQRPEVEGAAQQAWRPFAADTMRVEDERCRGQPHAGSPERLSREA